MYRDMGLAPAQTGSWGRRFTYCCAVYRTSHQRRKANRHEVADPEESKMCPLAHDFDLQIHHTIANLRTLDGFIPSDKDDKLFCGLAVCCFSILY